MQWRMLILVAEKPSVRAMIPIPHLFLSILFTDYAKKMIFFENWLLKVDDQEGGEWYSAYADWFLNAVTEVSQLPL